MNPIFKPSKLRYREREVMLLGLDSRWWELFPGVPLHDCELHFSQYRSGLEVYRYLLEKAAKPSGALPIAILADITNLETERFLFLRNLRRHPMLRNIPVIGIDLSGCDHRHLALKAGFDEYYVAPVSWDMVARRIEFLHRYKAALLDEDLRTEVSTSHRAKGWKRALDVLLSATALLLLSPLMLLIALAIKLESRGPVIYRSKRVGAGYHIFDFYKFRSMYQDADKHLHELVHLNQYARNGKSLFLKFDNDPRVTPLGRILRKTSLDELPQLFNILKGDMSIVGNRPLPVYEAELLTTDEYAARFLGPAGLTGLWQVTKRGTRQVSSEERIQLDIQYATNYSFWFDLGIILKTFPAMLQKENV